MSLGRLRQNSDAAISLTGKVVLAGIPLVGFARLPGLENYFRVARDPSMIENGATRQARCRVPQPVDVALSRLTVLPFLYSLVAI